MSVRPLSNKEAGYRTISTTLVEWKFDAKDLVLIDELRPATISNLKETLRNVLALHGKGYYHSLVLDTHGAMYTRQQLQALRDNSQIEVDWTDLQFVGRKYFLSFSSQSAGRMHLVSQESISQLVRDNAIPMVILNACNSAHDVQQDQTTNMALQLILHSNASTVLGFRHAIRIDSSAIMMKFLYKSLGAYNDLAFAASHARGAMYDYRPELLEGDTGVALRDWSLPVVYWNNNTPDNDVPRLSSRLRTNDPRLLSRSCSQCRQPMREFVGRDRDIQQIEHRLLSEWSQNILLLRGSLGVGKTALVYVLAEHLHLTGAIQFHFEFNCDLNTFSIVDVFRKIAKYFLADDEELRDFDRLSQWNQMCNIVENLIGTRILLTFDNFHLLSAASAIRVDLIEFLSRLKRGQSKVILTSWGDERKVAQHLFPGNTYTIDGLDGRASRKFISLLLRSFCNTAVLEDHIVGELIDKIGGYPRGLIALASKLKNQTPQEILDAFNAGNFMLNRGFLSSNAEQFRKRMDYAYARLCPDSQRLILCLAPFRSVLWREGLTRYGQALLKQKLTADLPIDHLEELIKEATNWGLLEARQRSDDFVQLQPLLYMYLDHRLQEDKPLQQAINAAFCQYQGELCLDEYSDRSKELSAKQDIDRPNISNALELCDRLSSHGLALISTLVTKRNWVRDLSMIDHVLNEVSPIPTCGRRALHYCVIALRRAVLLQILRQHDILKLHCRSLLRRLDQVKGIEQWIVNAVKKEVLQLCAIDAVDVGASADDFFQQMIDLRYGNEDEHEYFDLSLSDSIGHASSQEQTFYLAVLRQRVKPYEPAVNFRLLRSAAAAKGGKWEQAEKLFREATSIAEEHAPNLLCGVFLEWGNILRDQVRYKEGREVYNQAMDLCSTPSDQVKVYRKLGKVCNELKLWTEAEDHFINALNVKIEGQVSATTANIYRNIGRLAAYREDHKQAELAYRKVLGVLGHEGSMNCINEYASLRAGCLYQLGRIAEERQSHMEAEQLYKQARNIFFLCGRQDGFQKCGDALKGMEGKG